MEASVLLPPTCTTANDEVESIVLEAPDQLAYARTGPLKHLAPASYTHTPSTPSIQKELDRWNQREHDLLRALRTGREKAQQASEDAKEEKQEVLEGSGATTLRGEQMKSWILHGSRNHIEEMQRELQEKQRQRETLSFLLKENDQPQQKGQNMTERLPSGGTCEGAGSDAESEIDGPLSTPTASPLTNSNDHTTVDRETSIEIESDVRFQTVSAPDKQASPASDQETPTASRLNALKRLEAMMADQEKGWLAALCAERNDHEAITQRLVNQLKECTSAMENQEMRHQAEMVAQEARHRDEMASLCKRFEQSVAALASVDQRLKILSETQASSFWIDFCGRGMGKTVQATDDFLPSASERERSKAAVREPARDVGTGRRDDTLHIDVTSQVLIRLYLHATLTCMNKCSALRMCATKNKSKRTCSDTQATAQTPGLTDGEVKFDAIADQVQEVDARKDKCEELERELMSAQVFFAFLSLPTCTWCPCVGACAFFNSESASTPPSVYDQVEMRMLQDINAAKDLEREKERQELQALLDAQCQEDEGTDAERRSSLCQEVRQLQKENRELHETLRLQQMSRLRR